MLLPAAAGSFGVGVFAAQSPAAGVGIGAFTILTLMPWRVLFALMTFAAILNRFRFSLGTITFQPAHLLLIPLAIRLFWFTPPSRKNRWEWPEVVIVAFIGANVLSSVLFAPSTLKSLSVTGLLAMGVLAYLTVFRSITDRGKLIFAARAILIMALVNDLIALLATGMHYVLGSTWGVSISKVGAPAAGLAHEYNILGSMSASAAIAFLLLSREDNPVFSRRFCVIGFWICLAGLISSLTRGAWVAFAVALMGTLFIKRRGKERNRTASIGFAFLAISFGLLALVSLITASNDSATPNAIVARGSNLFVTSSGSGQARTEEWKVALGEWPKSPILGLGTNSYGQRHLAPKKRASNEKNAYIGNLYVRTLYDTGVVGLFLLIAFLWAVLWPKRIFRLSRLDIAPVAWAFMFMYATMAIAFFTTDASYQVWPWLLLGVARAGRKLVLDQTRAMRQTVPLGNGHASGNGHANGNGLDHGPGAILTMPMPPGPAGPGGLPPGSSF